MVAYSLLVRIHDTPAEHHHPVVLIVSGTSDGGGGALVGGGLLGAVVGFNLACANGADLGIDGR
jgi:hypothetical protein